MNAFSILHSPFLLCVLCVSAFSSLSSAAADELTGYEALADWDSLPNSKAGTVAGLASSFDRAGGNADFNQYVSPPGPQTTDVQTIVTTLTGPGVITRFWMPHAAADEAFTVRMTVDGSVLIDSNSDLILAGSYGYVQSPLVSTLIGGQVSYEPIAFQESLVIESNNYGSGLWARTHHYYQYGYHLLPAGRTVSPYTGALTAEQQAMRAQVVNAIANLGANPAGPSETSVTISHEAQSIDAGATLMLAGLAGSGRIRRINLQMAGAADDQLDGLRLRVRYDGRFENAIDVSVAHFFGAGHERIPYKSLPLGTDGPDGCYCYWPMPYRSGAVVELFNATSSAIGIDSAVLEYESGAVPAGAGYLHAAFAEEMTVPDQARHELLNIAGEGHYVGNLLYVQRSGPSRDILEGDDIIVVDGARTLYGTGMEDAYNGGYYYNHVLVQTDDGDLPNPESGIGPYHGLLHMDDAGFGDAFVRVDQYRWLIGDHVPFRQDIDVSMENIGQGAGVLFGSTAFYYLSYYPFGDWDYDGDVDLVDYNQWPACATGPDNGPPGAGCDVFDSDGDEDVDLADFANLAGRF